MGELPAVCEHLHLPVQSGSDRILEMMGRGYTAEEYVRAVECVRSEVPALAVTTDVIVGFPSETVEDFEATRSLMEKIGFDNAFIFKYSPRPDTPAEKWVDDVPAAEKMRRNQVLLADQEQRGLTVNGRAVGKTVQVLVEGVSLRNSSRWSGRTRTNKIVIFEPSNGMAVGDLIDVDVGRAMAQTLYGQPLPTAQAKVLCQ
jgi:tRNA-2-methylthio-N6-dimethylallyladenosine synthase